MYLELGIVTVGDDLGKMCIRRSLLLDLLGGLYDLNCKINTIRKGDMCVLESLFAECSKLKLIELF